MKIRKETLMYFCLLGLLSSSILTRVVDFTCPTGEEIWNATKENPRYEGSFTAGYGLNLETRGWIGHLKLEQMKDINVESLDFNIDGQGDLEYIFCLYSGYGLRVNLTTEKNQGKLGKLENISALEALGKPSHVLSLGDSKTTIIESPHAEKAVFKILMKD